MKSFYFYAEGKISYIHFVMKMTGMRIIKEDSAAILIDIQEKLFPHMADGDNLRKNCLKLIDGLQALSVPILVTQQYTKGLGPTIGPIAVRFAEFSFSEKISFSCCDDPGINEKILRLQRKNIVLFGIEAHVCVLQTCIDLLERDLMPVIVEDCISSRNLNDKRTAVGRMSREGAVVTTAESLLFELTRQAGSETFKKISGIVK